MPLSDDHWRRADAAEPGRLPADAIESLVFCFEQYVRGAADGLTLDRAFGVTGPSGSDPWFVRLARERRDRAYYRLAVALCVGGTLEEMADAVRRELRRPRRRTGGLPSIQQPIDAIHREAVRCGLPDSPDHIRKILAAQVAENSNEPVVFLKAAQKPE